MIRLRNSAALATLALAIHAGPAGAQVRYHYPAGYGAYGWGGWGGGGSTVAGDQARGMGVFAAGAGVYNQQTAVARSINSQTAMQWNEYLYQSQQVANRRYQEKMAHDQKLVNQTADSMQKRLRDNPTERDIMQGDALNVALDDITNPSVYSKALQGAKIKLAGAKIRDIPFQYAAGAITTSVDDLTQNGPPTLLTSPDFAADLAALRALRAKFRAQTENGGTVDPAVINEAKARIKNARATLEAHPDKYKKGSNDYAAAEKYLKGLYGLVSMLQTPAIDVLLAGVEKRPDTTLGDLLSFMQAFNLRFGVASKPEQRMVYAELYPMLDGLRDQILAANVPQGQRQAQNASAGDFFSGMDYSHLDANRTPPPPAPNP